MFDFTFLEDSLIPDERAILDFSLTRRDIKTRPSART